MCVRVRAKNKEDRENKRVRWQGKQKRSSMCGLMFGLGLWIEKESNATGKRKARWVRMSVGEDETTERRIV